MFFAEGPAYIIPGWVPSMNEQAFLEFLVSRALIAPRKKSSLLETARLAGERVDTTILENRLLSESTLLDNLGEFTRSKTCSVHDLESAGTELAGLFSPRVALRFGVVPFRRTGKTLDVAALDPLDFLIQDELRVLTGCMIRSHAVLEIRLRQSLNRLYGVELPVRMESLLRRLSQGGRIVERPPSGSTGKPGPEKKVERPVRREDAPAPRKKVTPSELEISDEDLKLFPSLMAGMEVEPSREGADIPTPPPLPISGEGGLDQDDDIDLEIRLARTSEALQRAEMRDDIADALFYFCRPLFQRKLLLMKRKDSIVGWRGEGGEVLEAAIRAISIPTDEPSAFLALLQGTPFWLGPLPPMPRNQELLLAMGPPEPTTCLILPLKVRGKVVAFFYGDSGRESMAPPPMAELNRLLAKIDIAFQVYLLKGKIRMI